MTESSRIEHDLREQPMAAAEIDDAAAAKEPPHPPRHLPRLVQFLARQASCVADSAGQPIEERAAGKAAEILVGQPAAGGGREAMALSYRTTWTGSASREVEQRSGDMRQIDES